MTYLILQSTALLIASRVAICCAYTEAKANTAASSSTASVAWVEAHKDDDEKTIRKLVFADEKRFAVCDASHRVWLLPHEPTPIRETRKYHACFSVFVFAVLHSQHTACCPLSRVSSSSSPSLHTPCFITVLVVCCNVFVYVVEKFAATISISAVITSYGAASLVVLEPNIALTGESYRDLLKDFHIPAVQTRFADNDFTWIQVAARHMLLFFRFLRVVCTHYLVCWLVVGGISRITLRFTLLGWLMIG